MAGATLAGGSTNPATADGEGAVAPQAGTSRTLPFTGVPALTLVSLALALVVAGAVLTGAGRRHREAQAA